jgi:hypothetical protein
LNEILRKIQVDPQCENVSVNLFNGQWQTLIKDGKTRAMYLPKNSTALIQPLDQGIIYSFKVNYIGFLLIVKKYQMRSYIYRAQ